MTERYVDPMDQFGASAETEEAPVQDDYWTTATRAASGVNTTKGSYSDPALPTPEDQKEVAENAPGIGDQLGNAVQVGTASATGGMSSYINPALETAASIPGDIAKTVGQETPKDGFGGFLTNIGIPEAAVNLGGNMLDTFSKAHGKETARLGEAKQQLNDAVPYGAEAADFVGAVAGMYMPAKMAAKGYTAIQEGAELAGDMVSRGAKVKEALKSGAVAGGMSAAEAGATGGSPEDMMWASFYGGGLGAGAQPVIGNILIPAVVGGVKKLADVGNDVRTALRNSTSALYTETEGVGPAAIYKAQNSPLAVRDDLHAVEVDPAGAPGYMSKTVLDVVENTRSLRLGEVMKKGEEGKTYARLYFRAIQRAKDVANEFGTRVKAKADEEFASIPQPREVMRERHAETSALGDTFSSMGQKMPTEKNPNPIGAQRVKDTVGMSGKDMVLTTRNGLLIEHGGANMKDLGPGANQAFDTFVRALREPEFDPVTMRERDVLPKNPRDPYGIQTEGEYGERVNNVIPEDMTVADLYRASAILNAKMSDMNFNKSDSVGWIKVKEAVDDMLATATGNTSKEVREAYSNHMDVEASYDAGRMLYHENNFDMANVNSKETLDKRYASLDNRLDDLTSTKGLDEAEIKQNQRELDMLRNGFMREMSQDWQNSTPQEFLTKFLGEQPTTKGIDDFFNTNNGPLNTLTKLIGADSVAVLKRTAAQYDKAQNLNKIPRLMEEKALSTMSEAQQEAMRIDTYQGKLNATIKASNRAFKKAEEWFSPDVAQMAGIMQLYNAPNARSRQLVAGAAADKVSTSVNTALPSGIAAGSVLEHDFPEDEIESYISEPYEDPMSKL